MSIIENGKLNIKNKFILAPMAGVTDLPFREMAFLLGCELAFTEMISAKGLTYKNKNTFSLLKISNKEKNVAVQLFGSEPEIIGEAVAMIEDMPFVMVDFNMACPVNKVVKNGEGSALMLDKKRASDIVKAIKNNTKKPVSIKIRKGFYEGESLCKEFSKVLEEAGADLISIHGRTREAFYRGKSDINTIKDVVNSVNIPVLGSGDIYSLEDGINLLEITKASGVLVARGARGNPFIFKNALEYFNKDEIEKKEYLENYKEIKFKEKIDTILYHSLKMCEYYGEESGIRKMRSYVSWYSQGEKNSTKLRNSVNHINTYDELKKLLLEYK